MPTSYGLHRTTTGRLASGIDDSDPDKGIKGRKIQQIQNFPKKIRDAFVADEGYAFVGADSAGIEWAIAIYLASKVNVPSGFHLEILDRFQRGEFDPHRYLASKVFNVPEEEVSGAMRNTAKPYTHGRTFLGSERGLAREAGHPEAVGLRVCNAHHEAFKLKQWQDYELDLVKRRRYVQTPLGWRRYFWEPKPKPQEILGTKVQATAADLCKWILASISFSYERWVSEGRWIVEPQGWEMLTSTHDSMLLHVPQEEVSEASSWLKATMEQPIPWLDNRSWRASVKVGQNWRQVS